MGEQDNVRLTARNILFLYIGSLMGAGFASGTEMWQFFGVFGAKGIYGVLLSTAVFMIFGYISVYNAAALGSSNMGKMIVPKEHRVIEGFVSGVMSVFLLMAYFSTLAAGGALLEEQFGLHHAIGSFILMLMVVFTAINGFGTVADRLRKLTPVLVIGTLLIGIYMVIHNFDRIAGGSVSATPASISPVAGHWAIAAIGFVAYNLTGAIAMLGGCALNARSKKHAEWGAILGGVGLGLCCGILYLTMLTDPAAAASTSLPMVVFCSKISPILRVVYSLFLLIAVFSTATSVFYGFTTALPPFRKRTLVIWVVALAGYAMSLFGFGNLVAFLYPIGGYCSLIFLFAMVVNFVRLKRGKRKPEDEKTECVKEEK